MGKKIILTLEVDKILAVINSKLVKFIPAT